MDVLVGEDAIGRPTRGRQAVVVTDGVASVDQTLQADAVGRLAIGSRGRRIRRRRQDDVTADGHGLIGEAIQRVDDRTRSGAVLADRVHRVEYALFDGDLLRAFREKVDQRQDACREQDEEADPAEETEQVPNHISASGNNTARSSGRGVRPRR